jgi:hypothetical protein
MKQKSKLKKYPQNPIKNQLGEKENRKKTCHSKKLAKRKRGKPCDWESWLRPASEGMLPSDQRDFILPSTTEDQRRFSGKIVELVEADILSNARNTMRQPQESVELEKKNEINLQST